MDSDPWLRLAARATTQQGVVATWQALRYGIAASTFTRHCHRYGWTCLLRGVWAMPGVVPSPVGALQAVLLATRPPCLLTGATVLWLTGVSAHPPSTVHVWLPPPRHLHPRPRVRYHRGAWVAGDRGERRRGLPCVPLLRALTDSAAGFSDGEFARCVAACDRLRLVTPGELAGYVERRGRFPGVARLRRVLHALDRELVHSNGERVARRLLASAGLRPHPRPLLVELRGRRIGEIDIPFPEARYGVEVDGPHHLLPEVARADRERDRVLEGPVLQWRIDRFWWDEIEQHPDGFVARVRRGYAEAAARIPA